MQTSNIQMRKAACWGYFESLDRDLDVMKWLATLILNGRLVCVRRVGSLHENKRSVQGEQEGCPS